MGNTENNIEELCPTVEGEIDVPETIFTSEAESYLTGDIITPQMFGAKADGVTDDSTAIRAAIAALPRKGGTLYFPPGVYIHGDGETGEDGTGNSYAYVGGEYPYRPNVNKDNNYASANVGRDIRFYFDGYTNLNILGYGAEIRSNDGNGQTRNNAMFMFYGCHGVKIKGLKLDGRRQERGVDQDDYIPGPINEFLQCNITFSYHCSDILIEDVTSVNSVHDGISIGWTNSNVKIINCVCDNAQRNGIAICGCENVDIEGCQCNYNGVSGDGYRGIAPKCGIDIEGHPIKDPSGIIISKNANTNVHVSNCSMERNELGFSIYNHNKNVTIEKCFLKDNPHLSVTDDGTSSELYIRDCTIINSRLYSGFTLIENNTIEQHYIPGATYTNGYSFDDTVPEVNESLPHTYRNNIFRFIIDDESSVPNNAYMGIRLQKNTEFIGNRVIGAFSLNNSMYPVMLMNSRAEDNVFERTYTTINGTDVTEGSNTAKGRIYYSVDYTSGDYRNNNDYGEYFVYGAKNMNRKMVTDTTIRKSYSFDGDQTNKIYRIPNTGRTTINALYLGQEEEVIYTSYDQKRIQHTLKRKSESQYFTASKILTVYVDYPYIYLKIHVPYPIFTVTREMEYMYGQYNESFFNGEIMTDVTADGISLPNNISINMIRAFGDSSNRPTYGNIPEGTTYFDTTIQKSLLWDGTKWIDKDGDDATNYIAFSIDGTKQTGILNKTFGSWVKSKLNKSRFRPSDIKNGSGYAYILTADGTKALYKGNTVIFDNYNVESGAEYTLKDSPVSNPDYSNVPVFWNGTELVTVPIYNGEVEDV